MSNAFRTRLREALGLPDEIEEEGGTGGGAGGGAAGGGAAAGGTGAGTGTGPGAGDGSGPGAGDGSGNGMEGGNTSTPIGHGFPLGWWRAGSYNKEKCPDGRHRDPSSGDCEKNN